MFHLNEVDGNATVAIRSTLESGVSTAFDCEGALSSAG